MKFVTKISTHPNFCQQEGMIAKIAKQSKNHFARTGQTTHGMRHGGVSPAPPNTALWPSHEISISP